MNVTRRQFVKGGVELGKDVQHRARAGVGEDFLAWDRQIVQHLCCSCYRQATPSA